LIIASAEEGDEQDQLNCFGTGRFRKKICRNL